MRRIALALTFVASIASLSATFGQEAKRNLRIERADTARDEAFAEAEEDYSRVRTVALDAWLAAYEKASAEARKAGETETADRLDDAVARSKRAGRAILPRPKDVVQFEENEYAFIPDLLTWEAAKRRCEAMGGHLVTIESAAEGDFVVRQFGQNIFWAGASDREVEGEWRWINGRPFAAFEQPSGFDDRKKIQHALCWLPAVPRWDDGDEGLPTAFVCEWER